MNRKVAIALVTAPDLKTARRLADAALKEKLAACVNLIPRIESHYWWEGRLDSSAEVLMVLKTSAARLESLEKLILQQHPYDTAEFVVLPVRKAGERYLAWWLASMK